MQPKLEGVTTHYLQTPGVDYAEVTNGAEKLQQEVMCDEVKTVKRFYYLGNKLNASGRCKVAVTARTRVGWKKFRECGKILFRKKSSLQMKGKVLEVKHGVEIK